MNFNYQDRYEQLGTRIMLLRRDAKLTQEDLAEKLGLTRNHISKVELGKVAPSVDMIFALSDLFKVTPSKLFELIT